MTNDNHPPREKAVIDPDIIETPESPKIIDEYARPAEITQELWDTFTLKQKKAHVATFKANKKHAERHGGK